MVLQIWHQDQVDSLNRDEVSKVFLPWLLKITLVICVRIK